MKKNHNHNNRHGGKFFTMAELWHEKGVTEKAKTRGARLASGASSASGASGDANPNKQGMRVGVK